MPEIPESAIAAAAEAIGLGMTIRQPPKTLALAALEAGSPRACLTPGDRG